MYQYEFNMPTKILFGPNQLKNLHKEKLPGEKALIVLSNGISTKKYGYLAQLEGELQQAQKTILFLMKYVQTQHEKMSCKALSKHVSKIVTLLLL